MVDPLISEINNAISRLGLDAAVFKAANEHTADLVLKQLQNEFLIAPTCNNWLWERFRDPRFSIQFENQRNYEYLDRLVGEEERYWFVVSGMSKFFVYEGAIQAIQAVIGECFHFEYYIMPPKYNWLLCENHHDYMIAVGKQAVQRLHTVFAESLG